MPGMDLEDVGKLIRLFVGVMSKEGVDVLEFVRERMSLVQEKQSTSSCRRRIRITRMWPTR
ncbi:MAG: hypothetical protein SPK00_12295 [Corynebacterium glucuronolyticum]|nr:hypothetical protein [Mycobacteriaceae bacterium]MDY5835498.1 hypothetical protein [Corynebacterium glucuronolyticum]